VPQFKSKTRTTKHLVREMLFADDSALVADCAADRQVLVNNFAKAAAQFSLKINIKTAECMYQPIKLIHPPPEPEVIMIDQEPVVLASDVIYLENSVFCMAKVDKELRKRLGKAKESCSRDSGKTYMYSSG